MTVSLSGTGTLEHPVHRVPRELGAVGEVELGREVLAIRFDGLRAETEIRRDLAGGHSRTDLLEDFELSIGQAIDRAVIFEAIDADRTRQHAFTHPRAQIVFSAQDLSDG